ncbi:GbsR/MarR family transcriptional regulator [Nonomuraea aurantiaca]|uniref:GbsR/MarR family transcriptional regulator n=1 Tax=Nonomuraea aurantiaca TaxID=2878562 RepID=UPI001CD9C3BD|nr:helix-turn-helix domain-containing protein [Nonomuraea aurantiaca]MCA2223572.1 MarR family transcriptional regulator [Nonomuraea aurantiaca]
MPGGRLTNQDRRQIAAGMAEGLTYAEIARGLGRPTSTITREVMRNGGSRGYRADQAHQATEGRARRRRTASAPAAPATTAAYGRDPEAVHDFTERVTALLLQTGLPRMIARVLSCLYATDSGSLTAAELVQRLRVSPASISMAVGYLEEQGLIRRERDARRRRERYVIDDDVWCQAFLMSAQRNAMLADIALEGAEILGAATPAGARSAYMGQFLKHMSEDMVQLAEHWRETLAAKRRAAST